MEEENRTTVRRILTIAAGVTLGMIGYQGAKFLWLIALEIMWKASRFAG